MTSRRSSVTGKGEKIPLAPLNRFWQVWGKGSLNDKHQGWFGRAVEWIKMWQDQVRVWVGRREERMGFKVRRWSEHESAFGAKRNSSPASSMSVRYINPQYIVSHFKVCVLRGGKMGRSIRRAILTVHHKNNRSLIVCFLWKEGELRTFFSFLFLKSLLFRF